MAVESSPSSSAGHPPADDTTTTTTTTTTKWLIRRKNDFDNSKAQCLGKRDKSFAGRIDPHVVEICGIINERDDMYTTSSCAGRCFMYRGDGIKSTSNFTRFRISHEKIYNFQRFFDLTTIQTDPSGGGDPIRTIGQYDHYKNNNNNNNNTESEDNDKAEEEEEEVITTTVTEEESLNDNDNDNNNNNNNKAIWLRFEPFILHVACNSLSTASKLMSAARPAFKNVGLTTWKHNSKYLVAIWGDEGLDMPLTLPDGKTELFAESQNSKKWLADLINERHDRNWNKINRFCTSVREMGPPIPLQEDDEIIVDDNMMNGNDRSSGIAASPSSSVGVPKSFDVIGDIAYLHNMPKVGGEGGGDDSAATVATRAEEIGNAIMKKNKSIKLVVARNTNLDGTERAPGDEGLTIIAGAHRKPLITTHQEYGIKCVVDLNHTFFSPRMGQERLRICQNVARGEKVLVLFAGVGMEALQIAGRSEASEIVAVELNEIAIQCFHRGHRMLQRNKAVKCTGAAERLRIIHGDVLDVLPNNNNQQFPMNYFDRILAPRPKEGSMDGDLGSGDGGEQFLNVLLPHLNDNGGECHWYDFAADHEYPDCQRTKTLIDKVCKQHGLEMDVLHVARVGSIAMRQLRICMDFKVYRR